MGCQYLAFVSSNGSPGTDVEETTAARLRELGFSRRIASRALTLFASADTPTLTLPGGSIIVGHIFSEEGCALDADSTILRGATHAHVRNALLRGCWGEYVLLQPASASWEGMAITRDPSGGVRCLYSIEHGSGFVTSNMSLASELGIHRRSIDWEHIAHRLSYPHLPTSRTGLVGIDELLPGTSLRVIGSQTSTTQEWSPWDFVEAGQRFRSVDEASAAVRDAVSRVVRTWANTDESLLLELSGGLDSSIVAACLKGTNARVACCTAITPFPGADERRYARLMADRLGIELVAEALGFDLARFDAPPPLHSVTPRVAALQHAANEVFEIAADRHGVSSFFSGAGGDSVFSYLRSAAPAADAFKERGFNTGVAAIHDLAELHQCTVWKAARLTLRKLIRRPKPPAQPNFMFLASDAPPTPHVHPWFSAPPSALPGDRERISVLSGTQTFRDCAPRGETRWMRMPLISQPVMEACLRAPSWMWITDGMNRAVARRAFSNDLPDEVFNRRSKGSFMTYSGAVYRRNQGRIGTFLLEGELEAHGLLDTAALRQFLERDLAPRDESFMRIFELCMIESWVRHQAA